MDLSAYLRKDVGERDLTTKLVVPDVDGTAYVICCEDAVVAGIDEASEIFEAAGADVSPLAKDGDRVRAGSRVMSVSGPLAGIITCKRTALGFLSRMTAVATEASEAVGKADGVPVTSYDASTPGFGDVERKAVAVGGGVSRSGALDSCILVRKEHAKACGSLRNALSRLDRAPFFLKKEAEVDGEDDARAAAEAGIDIILIRGKDADAARKIADAARSVSPGISVEVSCGKDEAGTYKGVADIASVDGLIADAGFKRFSIEML